MDKDKDKNKSGRPTKYDPAYNEQVEKLCKLGATDDEIANFFNVDVSTINNWKHQHEGFFESIKKGKDIADMEIAESLYQRAKGYEHEITQTKERKYYPPDPTSMIFWLKNRRKNHWRDKQDINHTGSIAREITFITHGKIKDGKPGSDIDDEVN